MHIPCYIAGKAIYLPSYMAFRYIAHILCYIAHAYTMLYSLLGRVSMRCESHFKINAEPVAAMAAGGPAAGGRRQASSLGRPKVGPSLDLNPLNPFQKPLEVQ